MLNKWITKLFLVIIIIPYLSGCNMNKNPNQEKGSQAPNIVYILADDLGYGDLSCLNDSSAVQTPHIDALAEEGMAFTDAHSDAAVCTPTRYGLLTGRYSWRSLWRFRGYSYGFRGYTNHMIDPETMTVASFLKGHGYNTACIGKWHLGMDWPRDSSGEVDFSKPIKNGPITNGFQYYFGIPASMNHSPYVFIENDRVTSIPTDTIAGRNGLFDGFIADGFVQEEVLPILTQKAVDYIDQQSEDKPFFLYFSLTAPHNPILPTEEFQGKTGSNYLDFVLMVDHMVGQVIQAINLSNFKDNTLVVFTSDNGAASGAIELTQIVHRPNYHFRGHKADTYEGGHRIPFIARWPDRITGGSISDETICLDDLLATCADILNDSLPDSAGEDSYSILPVLLGQEYESPLREATVNQSVNGSLAIRKGKWKLIFCPPGDGRGRPTPEKTAKELGLPLIQLYYLENDVAERNNVAENHPEVVESLTALMERYIKEGRSTPGKKQENYGEVKLTPEVYD